MPFFQGKGSPASVVKKLANALVGPSVDNLVADPDAYRFRLELESGRWGEFHDFLESTTDWPVRHFYVHQLSKIKDRPGWLDEWVAAQPASAIPLLFRGAHALGWAWQARGSGRASTVRKDAWPDFHARLVAADKDFARAAELDPKDPTPCEMSLTAARGLSLGQAEIRRRFDEAHLRDPMNAFACVNMIQAIAKKWGGSHEAMFEFARWASREAPEGHSAHKAIALAHIEMWLDISFSQQRYSSYFQLPAVKAEIQAAAARSILSPLYPGGVLSWSDRNTFAFCFRFMGDGEAMLNQMRLIGPRVTSFPWEYLGDPATAYRSGKAAFR